MAGPVSIQVAVEGIVDEAVARRLILQAGGRPGTIYGKNGKPALRQKIKAYNNAARHYPWLVLVDLDNDADCAPPLRTDWLPQPAPNFCFRIAVRQVESWLMADPQTLSAFLRVPRSRISSEPENLPNAKQAMVNLARSSRKRSIVQDMVPRERSGRQVGPAYSSRIIEYVDTFWRPQVAAGNAPSLRKAIACLERLIAQD